MALYLKQLSLLMPCPGSVSNPQCVRQQYEHKETVK